ncbi:putative bifunctional diguanylate cyclase/phosphodiesterase [Jannaschia sp. R86511]|uniref:putative bifunctional diguanylate cyclase/phosphodiesterase n=1 Tax=Jannaschia sp. R86511 TaxID=3093853 RepID=UPI0036D358C0
MDRSASRTGTGAVEQAQDLARAAMDLGGLVVQPRSPGRRADGDELTGLPGRTTLERLLADALLRARPDKHGVGLVVCGVDRLSTINYRLGRDGGDDVLRQTALRLTRAVGPRGVLHRLGGDEFAVLVPELRHPGDLRAVAAAMLREARRPLRVLTAPPAPGRSGAALGGGGPVDPLSEETVTATLSIGVASVGWDGATRDLVREADLALHRAKDHGRDRLVVFDESIRAEADAALESERRLRRALAEEQLRLYLQPIVDLGTGECVGSEALVRLVDGRGSVRLPVSFIDIAEDRGLVSEIDRWAIARATDLLARDAAPAVAVNLSARSFDRIDVAGRVAAALEERAVDPARLHLEVTESSLALSESAAVATLRSLREYGCHVSIDDFGTGYSSLAYLSTYPADSLKIDRAFVAGLGRTTREDAVVQAVITLAHAHGMTVVAEGVERQEQARMLLQMGCDQAQGWYFGRPQDPDGATAAVAPPRR